MSFNPFKTLLFGFAFSPSLKANVFEVTRLASFFNASLLFVHVGEKTTEKGNPKKPELTPVEKLLQDNQISRAVDLIRGINLFSNNKKIISTAKYRKKSIQNKVSSFSH